MNSKILNSLLILPDTTVKQAMQKLSSTGEKILFVVNKDNKLLGTLTDGDIRKKIIMGMKLDLYVKEIMQLNFTYLKDDDLQKDQKSIHLMKQKKIDQIPILNSEGIIKHVISWVDYIENSYCPIPKNSYSVVIMAGGKGTRLDPFTRILPKPLIPLNNKPIIEHIMDKFYDNGFHHFFLIINYKKEIIKMYINENHFPYKVDFIEENIISAIKRATSKKFLKSISNLF
ncbi:nucleotidyl transferase, partial [Candidatus Magnetomorum sp. HK-1]